MQCIALMIQSNDAEWRIYDHRHCVHVTTTTRVVHNRHLGIALLFMAGISV